MKPSTGQSGSKEHRFTPEQLSYRRGVEKTRSLYRRALKDYAASVAIRALAREGLSRAAVARIVGIDELTLNRWIKQGSPRGRPRLSKAYGPRGNPTLMKYYPKPSVTSHKRIRLPERGGNQKMRHLMMTFRDFDDPPLPPAMTETQERRWRLAQRHSIREVARREGVTLESVRESLRWAKKKVVKP